MRERAPVGWGRVKDSIPVYKTFQWLGSDEASGLSWFFTCG